MSAVARMVEAIEATHVAGDKTNAESPCYGRRTVTL